MGADIGSKPARVDEDVNSNRTGVCPLLDNSGQSGILPQDGLSADEPKRTFTQTACVASGVLLDIHPIGAAKDQRLSLAASSRSIRMDD
jgi:hypothetical protein